MGLLTILKKLQQKERQMRLLVLGLDNAGKTTLVKRWCGQFTGDIEPTLGFQIQTLEYQNYTLHLWDVGGQKSIRSYWRNYFEQTDGVIFVIDSVDVVRLDDCRKELQDLLQQERLAGASLLVLANKQDVATAQSGSEIAQHLELSKDNPLYDKRHWNIVPCSAVSGEGLIEGMDWLVEDIASRIFMMA